jgi:precorrin-2 dehydrogenase/sirohydrochlorin ferrochelatase
VNAVNVEILAAGRAAGILVNIVDVPDMCDFYVPGSLVRGDLQISISTSGACPAMAKSVRKRLEPLFGPEYADYVAVGGWLRIELLAKVKQAKQRQMAMERFLDSDALERLARGDEAGARQIAADCLQEALDGKVDS